MKLFLDWMGWDGFMVDPALKHSGGWMTSRLCLWGKNPKCTQLEELHRGQCFLAGKLRTKTC